MGLLDALYGGGGSSGGGLLDFLRQMQPQQSFSGLQSDQAQYQPMNAMPQMQPLMQPQPNAQSSPLDNAQWPYGPNGAPSQANAQMQPQQPQAAPPEQPLPPAFGGGSIFGRIGNPDGLIAKLTGNDSRSLSQQNLRAQYEAVRQALITNGENPQAASSKAMIAAMNPEAAKTILPELFTSKEKYQVTSENPIEGKKYGFVNERDQTINGQPLGAGAGGSQSSGGLLAPGATYDPNRTGEDYLNQFSPEVKAAVKAYINGDVLPSGNPRQQGIASQAKTIAQKYGADMGIPVSDALFAEKRKYRTELGTNSANSAGGQAKAFNQGISHLTSLADNLEKLDNSNGLGIPFIAQGANAVRQASSNQQSAIADEAKSIGQTVAGEVGKLFSGSAGGGVHEREMTRERFNTVKSKPQLAAALRATLETMDGGLKALEQRRDSILGPNSGVELVGDATRQNIEKIQGAIDRLEGRSSAPASTKSGVAGSVQEGATATNPQTGAKITFRNGKWQ